MTQSNLKKFFYTVLIALGIVLLIGGRGIMNIRRIYRENNRIRGNIERLEILNGRYEVEIQALRTSVSYQEKVIREVLGFTKDNEIIYVFE